MLKVCKLCAVLGWIFGTAGLILAVPVKLKILPMWVFDTEPRGILIFAAVWFLLSMASRNVFDLVSEQKSSP